MVLFALIPPNPPRTQRRKIERTAEKEGTEGSMGFFFWILVIGLGIVIAIYYLTQVPRLRAFF